VRGRAEIINDVIGPCPWIAKREGGPGGRSKLYVSTRYIDHMVRKMMSTGQRGFPRSLPSTEERLYGSKGNRTVGIVEGDVVVTSHHGGPGGG